MQIEEFLEESGHLLQWLDESDAVLQTKDPSPADEYALEELIEKIKVRGVLYTNNDNDPTGI